MQNRGLGGAECAGKRRAAEAVRQMGSYGQSAGFQHGLHSSKDYSEGGDERSPKLDRPEADAAEFRVGLKEGFRSILRRHRTAGELLPRLSTLTYGHCAGADSWQKPSHRRYISVALSLGSPPAAVSRYPAL